MPARRKRSSRTSPIVRSAALPGRFGPSAAHEALSSVAVTARAGGAARTAPDKKAVAAMTPRQCTAATVAAREAGALRPRAGSWSTACRIAAPVAYLAALAATTAAWGLPLARDQLFLWLGLGMAAFSVSAWRSWGRMLLEWLPFFGLLVAYDFLRGAVSVEPWQAHLLPQVDLDKALFGGSVPTV